MRPARKSATFKRREDHGQITKIASDVKSEYDASCLEIVADKGYECPEDQAEALARGIVPNVITRSGSNTTKVNFDYKEAAITDKQKASSKPEDIKVCLQTGIIPDIYQNILSQVEIKEKNTYNKDTLIKAVHPRKKDKQENTESKTQKKKVTQTIASYTLHLAMSKMEQRKCLSEHPFGTIKRTLGSYSWSSNSHG